MILTASASVTLFAAVLFLTAPSGILANMGDEGVFTGASLLSAENGGDILTAVIAFMVGVFVTVGIRMWRKKHKENEQRRE